MRQIFRAALVAGAGYAMAGAQSGGVAQSGAVATQHAREQGAFVAHQALSTVAARVELVKAVAQRDKEALKTATVQWLDAEAAKHFDVPVGEKLAAALASPIGESERDRFLEKPDLLMINPGKYSGETVYFINGMATPRERAEGEARELSDQLKQPVMLLYNPTAIHGTSGIAHDAGLALDVAEAVSERSWPLTKAGLQPDEPTRQLAWVFVHAPADARISVVSHSQGCLIVRNALVLASRMGGNVADRMEWVATGLPLRDEEILPRPARLQVIAHAADPVSQSIGMRLDPREFTRQKMEAHFFSGYVCEVQLQK
jgi:hypothetical protein